MKSDSLRKTLVLILSFASLTCIAVGVGFAIHSPLFTLQTVEVSEQSENAPVDAQTITGLAAVELGKVNLFDLDLKAIEKRILSHPWIRQVNLVKRFPSSLSISVVYRDPWALIQDKNGSLSYVDSNGKIFGRVNVLARSDLPLISGVDEHQAARIAQALSMLSQWKKSSLDTFSQISSLHWDEERGFRAWIVYPMQDSRSRTVVDLGQDFDAGAMEAQFHRLGNVIQYLSQHSVAANQIWADSGKKIVVRTTHGS